MEQSKEQYIADKTNDPILVKQFPDKMDRETHIERMFNSVELPKRLKGKQDKITTK